MAVFLVRGVEGRERYFPLPQEIVEVIIHYCLIIEVTKIKIQSWHVTSLWFLAGKGQAVLWLNWARIL